MQIVLKLWYKEYGIPTVADAVVYAGIFLIGRALE